MSPWERCTVRRFPTGRARIGGLNSAVRYASWTSSTFSECVGLQRVWRFAASRMNCRDCSTFSAWARRCSYMTLYFCTSCVFSR